MNLIDISHWQGYIDFNKVKEDGIEGVIIKAGGSDAGFYEDSYFKTYYQKAKEAGLYVGSYYFPGRDFLSREDGLADARRFLEIIKDKSFELPVFVDIEAQPTGYRKEVTEAIIAFCDYLEQNGYFVGVYASDISGFKDRISYYDINEKYVTWVARYESKPIYAHNYSIWQYTSSSKVNGILGNVDKDECFEDFPSIIINGGFNNCKNEEINKPSKKSNDEIAKEVIQGLWGNGEVRKERLYKAGYNYEEIQKIVNEILLPKRKSNEEIAGEVIRGEWGNGHVRKDRLTAAGYNYQEIQKIVNKMLGVN